jgi:hypothetical protein
MKIGAEHVGAAAGVAQVALQLIEQVPPPGRRRRRAPKEVRQNAYLALQQAAFGAMTWLDLIGRLYPF